jgi:hypothetical protein
MSWDVVTIVSQMPRRRLWTGRDFPDWATPAVLSRFAPSWLQKLPTSFRQTTQDHQFKFRPRHPLDLLDLRTAKEREKYDASNNNGTILSRRSTEYSLGPCPPPSPPRSWSGSVAEEQLDFLLDCHIMLHACMHQSTPMP